MSIFFWYFLQWMIHKRLCKKTTEYHRVVSYWSRLSLVTWQGFKRLSIKLMDQILDLFLFKWTVCSVKQILCCDWCTHREGKRGFIAFLNHIFGCGNRYLVVQNSHSIIKTLSKMSCSASYIKRPIEYFCGAYKLGISVLTVYQVPNKNKLIIKLGMIIESWWLFLANSLICFFFCFSVEG